jgi:hypothetical protein
VRQKLGNPGNGMIGDTGENIFEPDERINSDALTGSYETPQHRGGLATLITAKEHPVVAAHCHHASILPMSGTKLMFTIVGIHFTVDDFGCNTANNALAAGLSMLRWRPAQ